MPDINSTLLLWLLWRHVPEEWFNGSFLTLYDSSKLSYHIPASVIPEAINNDEEILGFAEYATNLNKNKDLWICAALRDVKATIEAHANKELNKYRPLPPLNSEAVGISGIRGSRQLVSLLSALTVEFDIGQAGHAKSENSLPGSREQIDEAISKAGIAPPSAIVSSGGGYHYWWVLEEAIRFKIDGNDLGNVDSVRNRFRTFQKRIANVADFHIDSTAGAERHWRLPGTFNRKIRDNPRPVEFVEYNETLHSLNDLSPTTSQRKTKAVSASLKEAKELANSAAKGEDRDFARLRTFVLSRAMNADLQPEFILLLAGKSYAAKGKEEEDANPESLTRGRNNTTYRMLSTLIFSYLEARQLATRGLLVDQWFGPILKKWHEDESKREWTVDYWNERVEGILVNFEEKEKKNREVKQEAEDFITRNLKEKVNEEVTVEDKDGVKVVPRVIQFQNEYFIYSTMKGDYAPRSFKATELWQTARQEWGTDNEGDLYRIGENNKMRKKKHDELCHDYGVVTYHVVQTVIRQASFYSKEKESFYHAIAIYRPDLEPIYSEVIDDFLKTFAGKFYDLLQDYIASFMHLDQPCAGMYLEGPPRSGKGFIADGLASIWDSSPTVFDKFLGPDKFGYLKTPLIHLDEGVQEPKGITSRIRGLITQQNSHEIEKKNRDPYSLEGTLRLLITANNPDVITETGISHTRNDIDAVIERIAHIDVQPGAIDWLRTINEILKEEQRKEGRPVIGNRELILSGEFANHVAWLGENRMLERDRLFCATDEMTSWHLRYLLHGSSADSDVLQWVARFATKPEDLYMVYPDDGHESVVGVRGSVGDPKNRGIVIRSQEVLDAWQVYMRDVKKPSIKMVNRALDKVCDQYDGLYHVRLEFLKLYVEQNLIGKWDQIEKNIAGEKKKPGSLLGVIDGDVETEDEDNDESVTPSS